ncbi:MAG: MarR family transcriptional regulator [Trueperaceae bacterium]|nr:MarR family transcriptional regulator [Trueperaceae bacterium]
MEPTFDLEETKACTCLAARKEARSLTRRFERALRPHGLRATQFSILAALALRGPTRLGALAEMLGLERTTLTRGVALLERSGWVASASSPDARERTLLLTAAGRRCLDGAFPAWKRVQDDVLAERVAGVASSLGVGVQEPA